MIRRSRGRGGNGQHNNGGHSGHNGNHGGPRRSGGNGGNGVPNRHQVYDSNGPEVRIRGNAYQVYDKYQALARDAQAAGDRVKTENYLQHAEHYYRIILAIQEATGEAYKPRNPGEPGAEGDVPADGAAMVMADPASMPQPSSDPADMAQPPAAEAVA